MNSTQKGAWLFLFCVLLSAVTSAYVGSIFVFGRVPPTPFGRIGPVSAFVLIPLAFIVLTILFLAKRQSRVEPEADERDHMIRGKALAISSAGGCLLLAVVLLILGLTLGETGSIPIYLLTIILWAVFTAAILIYAVAILVQYGWTHKDKETNHE